MKININYDEFPKRMSGNKQQSQASSLIPDLERTILMWEIEAVPNDILVHIEKEATTEDLENVVFVPEGYSKEHGIPIFMDEGNACFGFYRIVNLPYKNGQFVLGYRK